MGARRSACDIDIVVEAMQQTILADIKGLCGGVREDASRKANGQPAPISFSNGSRGGGSVVSVIDAFGCLRSLRAHRHLMGLAGYGAAWLKSQSADQIVRMLQYRRRLPCPPSGVVPARELVSVSCLSRSATPV